MRFLRTICAVAVLAGVFAASALAFGFTDEALLPPDLHLGSPYSFQLSARSGCPPYYYEQQSGNFPPGVSMTSDGLISGTPPIGGSYQTWLAVKNQCPGDSSERLFTFYVVDPQPFVIKTDSLLPAVKGTPYQAELLSSEAGVLTWSVSTGQLPTGLTLDKGGVISGTPLAGGSFAFRVKVNDGRRSTTQDFTLLVPSKPALLTKRLPSLTVGHAFRLKVPELGGVAPLTWRIVGGKVPPGVTLAGGVLSGKPRVAGAFRFAVKGTDSLGSSSTRTFVLVVKR
jgi:hypothetical protein